MESMSLHCTCPPYLASKLFYGFVDIPAILLILLLSHICKHRLDAGARRRLSMTDYSVIMSAAAAALCP